MILCRRKEFDEGLPLLERFTQLAPTIPDYRVNYGLALNEAERLFRRLISSAVVRKPTERNHCTSASLRLPPPHNGAMLSTFQRFQSARNSLTLSGISDDKSRSSWISSAKL